MTEAIIRARETARVEFLKTARELKIESTHRHYQDFLDMFVMGFMSGCAFGNELALAEVRARLIK